MSEQPTNDINNVPGQSPQTPRTARAAVEVTSVTDTNQEGTVVGDSSETQDPKPFTKKMKLTRKQRVYVNALLKNPTMSGTQAAKLAYDVKNDNVARVISSENLTKPAVISHLQDYSTLTEQVLTNTITRYKDSEDLNEVKEATLNARWMHDKIHGKATQKTENTNLNVNLSDIISDLR